MPRQKGVAVENNFIKGLFTEATGLKYPENACTDADNCVFDPFGTVSRRLGFDLEDLYEVEAITETGKVFNTYLWENVAGDGNIVFTVVQVGNTLYFYRVSSDGALSASLHATTIDLASHLPSGVTTAQTLDCQFASGNGLLFVTNQRVDSFFVEYDTDGDDFTATEINLQIRDFEGDLDDTETIVSRPSSTLGALNAHHRYNLENQGWTSTTLTAWDAAQTTMPSNADVSHYYKNSSDAYDFSIINNYTVGNSRAPNGHFIYTIYDINRASNVGGATEFEIPLDRVTVCAFFAGRAWYAGIKAPEHNSKILFSQIVENKDQYGMCYQSNDPTSELISDLLPTDGGVIDINDVGTIFKLIPVLNTLIVIASNGVWAITGSQGLGFVANDYSVTKLDDVKNISSSSIVMAEGMPYWWNNEGIYTITRDPQSNALATKCITDSTIRTFYNDILSNAKLYVKGAYDSTSKTVQWIYRSTEIGEFVDKYHYDRMLTLNLISSSFSPWSVNVEDVNLSGIVNIFGLSGTSELNDVFNGLDDVVNGSDDVITFGSSASAGISSTMKYLVHFDGDMTWAECYKDSFMDWSEVEEVDYESYFVTGYKIRGEGIRKFQSNYIRVYTDNDRTSSFNLQSRWDFAITGNSGRWSSVQPQTVVMDDADIWNNRTKRLKLRGHGLVMQLRFSSQEGEPFDIIGWVTQDSVNKDI